MDISLPFKKSWQELRQDVRDMRRHLSDLSTKVPSSFTFRTLTNNKTRVYFLSSPSNGRETSLMYVDISSDSASWNCKLQWQQLFELAFQALPSMETFSKEEQLMWERKRLVTWGITSYEVHEETGKFVFPAASSLFQCVDNGTHGGPLFPSELKTESSGARLNPQICPFNSDLVAYVSSCDLWVSHAMSGSEKRLTYAHKGKVSLTEDPLSAGIPAYVTQEEFSRYQGYWWQPHSKDGKYRIAYEEVDESEVELLHFASPNAEFGGVDEYRFPRAGTPNAKSSIKMTQFKVDENSQIVDVEQLELRYLLTMFFPWFEYLLRVGWTPDGEFVWAQLLDRKQQRLELVLLPVESFCQPPPYLYTEKNHYMPTPPVQVIYSYQAENWINVNDLLHFLPSTDPSQITFVCAGEETGYRHLYLISAQVCRLPNCTIEEGEEKMESYLRPRITRYIALTSGEWEVLDKSMWVDENYGLAYFLGLRDTPLEKHLYVTSYIHPEEVRRLTALGYSHNVCLDKKCSMFVTVYSNILSMPACQAFCITHTDSTVNGVTITPAGYLMEPSVPEVNYEFPELYTHQIASGDILYAMIFKPHNIDPSSGRKYPVVLNIYGGPEVQLVSNTFKGMRHLRMHMLAAQGYCVIAIDSRGSQHRGVQFESYLKSRMGTVEIQDQVEVLHWLAKETGYMDLNRVAVHGWSYGGYLSLMALAQYPGVFKLAIAGAPVTSWNLYDTGYTERYMDLPSNNPDGYKFGSVLSYIDQFPDEVNRLLIIHGLIDENVHFFHTSQLINALVKAGKPYQLQIYPKERHSLRHLDASEHYETTLLSFLQSNL